MFKHTKRLQLVLVSALLVVANVLYLSHASAAGLTQTQIAETNMMAAGTSQIALAFKTSATGGGTAISLTFTGWTGGTAGVVNATQPVTNGCTLFSSMTGYSPLPGTPAASGNASTGVISFTGVTALAASTNYCVTLTSGSAVTNPTATGVYPVSVVAGNDSTTAAVDSISNDYYTVSATVAPTFTMSLPSTTDSLGTLSPSALTTSTGVTATVVTNAASGWYVWAKDSNAGLKSATQNYTIATVTPGTNASLSTAGSEKYALGVTTGNATTAYADAGGTTGSGLSTTVFNPIASGTGPTASSAVTMKELADISGVTPASSDYSDVITVVGAGSF